jgi:hypothetical protein
MIVRCKGTALIICPNTLEKLFSWHSSLMIWDTHDQKVERHASPLSSTCTCSDLIEALNACR